jgi:hypothetical protein
MFAHQLLERSVDGPSFYGHYSHIAVGLKLVITIEEQNETSGKTVSGGGDSAGTKGDGFYQLSPFRLEHTTATTQPAKYYI